MSPKTALSFHNFLKRLIDISGSYYTHSDGLLHGNDTLKSVKGKHRAESGKTSNIRLPLSLGHIFLLASMCGSMCRILTTPEAPMNLGAQTLYWGFITWA